MVATRFFRGALTQLRIRILRCPGVEVAEETVKLSRYARLCYISAKFAPHLFGSPVKGSRQLCCRGVELKTIHYYLLPLHCGQRSPVGNGFIRSAVMVWSVPTGRATAKNVSAQCKCASEKPPLKKCVCLTANDLITPHPSQATPSPQATQGKAMTKPRLRAVVLTASEDATKRNG